LLLFFKKEVLSCFLGVGETALSWSAKQYLTFEDERTRPVRDLLAAVPTQVVRSAVDLGCGPGNSTELLAARFPTARVIGIDSSSDMIAAARARLPNVPFEKADVVTWNPDEPFDTILANAVLQWLPGHASLFPRLVGKLAPGGSLAVQMPDNVEEPTHRLMRALAADGPWAGKLARAAASRPALGGVDWFYALLRPLCTRVDIWRTIYHHPLMGGADAVVEWFKGSALGPFLKPLDDDERTEFLERYKKLVEAAYTTLPDGVVLLPFPRLFIVATS